MRLAERIRREIVRANRGLALDSGEVRTMCAVVARLTYVIDISSILNLRGRKLRSLDVGNTNRLSRFDR
jgi:hypothetical protein